MRRFRAKLVYLIIGLGAVVFAVGLSAFFLNVESFPVYDGLKVSFAKMLIKVEPVPSASFQSPKELNAVIYVLGGSQQSLETRFRTAAALYHQGMSPKILILSRSGITAYSPQLGRNLTNNEWAVKKLESFGVPEAAIEPVKIEDRFFGTFSEAEGISGLVLNRGYKTLVLVSSQYHTMRVWESFSKFVKNKDVNLFIYASNDHLRMHTLLQEYLKLEFYEGVLL